ncbi:MAG: rhomboid family intramembrane serine protease [Thermodesulfobacteriota bacterium]
MLIVPVSGKISLRNPPVITIALIILNCIIFFAFQFNENQIYWEAEEYYRESGLLDIEIDAYLKYRYTAEQQDAMFAGSEKISQEKRFTLYSEMRQDWEFMHMLEGEQIIRPQDAVYQEWKALRAEYTDLLSRIVSKKYGFKPASPSIITLFTHMFLHGGFGHLVGNMIFLWLVGSLLEMGSGRFFYFTTYILTGLGAVGLFWVGNMHSNVPLVGASGAIAGLMGTFTVLYGWKKIKIFFSIGVFFNYFKIRAIVLLPLWVGAEVYQIAFSEVRHVAYLAHVGGLISGALLGLINKRFLGFYDEDVVDPEPEDEISPLIEKALAHIGQLEMEQGEALLQDVLKKEPKNIAALKHLYEIHKTDPEKPQFHTTAKQVLKLSSRNEETHSITVDVYTDYVARTKLPKLSAGLYLRLITILAGKGHLKKAEQIAIMFLNKKPGYQGLSTALLRLSNKFKMEGDQVKHKTYLNIILSEYSNTVEAKLAKAELDEPGNV